MIKYLIEEMRDEHEDIQKEKTKEKENSKKKLGLVHEVKHPNRNSRKIAEKLDGNQQQELKFNF